MGASNSDRRVGREDPDDCRCASHDQQRDEERVLAPHEIADAAKKQGTKRPDDEPDSKR